MADKMLRIAGRGADGLAKALKTDDVGNLKTTTINELLYKNDTEFIMVPDESLTITINSDTPFLHFNARWFSNHYMEVMYRAYEVSSGRKLIIREKQIHADDSINVSSIIENVGNQQEIVIKNATQFNVRVLGLFVRSLNINNLGGKSSRMKPVALGGKTDSSFGGKVKTLTSSPVDVSKMTNLSILASNNSGSPITLSVVPILRGLNFNIRYYDWNTETWKSHTAAEGGVTIPSQDYFIYDLSTHPDLYWFKDFKVDNLRIRAVAENMELATGNFSVWVGGDLNA